MKRIPAGRVATYGQVARLAGLGSNARQVGYALHRLPAESAIPWHRVINASGRISLEKDSLDWHRQRALLQAEGVDFREGGEISLSRYQWQTGRTPSRRRNRR